MLRKKNESIWLFCEKKERKEKKKEEKKERVIKKILTQLAITFMHKS
jgi:hypothetical protein